MNIFVAHPQEQGVTYREHLIFAMGVASRLLRSALAFALHAVFPFIGIDRSLDLTATSRFLQERNEWIERQEPKALPNSAAAKPGQPLGQMPYFTSARNS